MVEAEEAQGHGGGLKGQRERLVLNSKKKGSAMKGLGERHHVVKGMRMRNVSQQNFEQR